MVRKVGIISCIMVLVSALTWTAAPSAHAWDGCGQSKGTPGMTITVGGKQITVPPTQDGLVAFCLFSGGPEASVEPLQINPQPNCGQVCFTATTRVTITDGAVGPTIWIDGQQYTEPIPVSGTSVPVCIAVGNPIPSCGGII